MRTIKIKPVEIMGNCRANLTLDDEFEIRGMNLENPRPSNLCFLALGNLPSIVAQLQAEHHFFAHVSCPDCLARLEGENRVVFLAGHADKWELCQAISEYCRLCRACAEEPEVTRQLADEAIQYQQQGEYPKAVQTMTEAVAELRRVVA